jgi:hypothetical protein
MVTPNSVVFQRASIPLVRGTYRNGGEAFSLDQMIGEQVYDIMIRDGDTLDSICEHYRSSVHRWFPVVHDIDSLIKTLHLRSNLNAEIWILLLSINLIVRMTKDQITATSSEGHQLYLTTKTLHAFVQSSRNPTIESVQAGLLIALYEHCQALQEAAFLSIGACARTGYVLGLDKALFRTQCNPIQEDETYSSKRHVWWCIILLERYEPFVVS